MDYSLFEGLPFGTILKKKDGEIVFANTAFCEIVNYSLEGLLETNYNYELVCLADQPVFLQHIESLKNQASVELRKKYTRSDGRNVSVLYRAKNFTSDEDLIIAQVAIYDNIASLDAIFLDAIMKGLPDLMYFKNRKSQILKVTDSYLKRFKIKRQEDIIGKTDFDLFSREHAEEALKIEQELVAGGDPMLNVIEKETYEDNRITWVSTSKLPLKDRNGDIIGTFGISSDITERVNSEAENRFKTSILNALVEKMPIVIYRYDITGVIPLFGNDDLFELFQQSKVVKLNVAEGLSMIVRKIKKEPDGYVNFLSTNSSISPEMYFDNFVFAGEGNKDYVGVALDITDRKEAEMKIKRNARGLEKTNKELNEFAYIVSHDLKAPLRAIVNLADWIQEDLGEVDADVQANIALMKGRVHRMENLINGILQYSRVTKGARVVESVDVKKLLEESVDALGLSDKFTVEIPDQMPTVQYAKIDLDRVFTNLISNAIKYHHKKVGKISILTNEDETFYYFSVKDDGPGIDPSYHERIFKIFQTLQARDTKESTGIGLTIVKKIVEERGGTIEIDSSEGSGATFTFSIPKIPLRES